MNDGAIRDEDKEVIESIRRLVTDRSAALRGRGTDAGFGPSPVADKLVLTPALRVEPEGESASLPAEPDSPDVADQPEPVLADPGETTVAWSLEDRIAELEAALGGATGDWEPDGSEDTDQETPSRFVFAHRPLPLTGREAVPDTRPARAAEVASAAGLADEPPVVPAVAGPPPEMAEAPAEPATVVPEPDGAVDPDVLRALITEIVREELRGALGHKATRNIRRLVRREIRLALDLHDLGD
jgi:hypothetical protein